MKFDILTIEPCVLPQEDDASCTVGPGTPPVPPGGIGDRRLVIRPELAVVLLLGNVQYRTFLVANGMESEVTSGLSYRSSSPSIAVIGAIGGNATGFNEGICTISVEWQELTAYAQLQVVESCEVTNVATVVVVDKSSSMSQAFGGAYGTKLDFAKSLASQYVGETNVNKDTVGLVAFSSSIDFNSVHQLSNDILSVNGKVTGIYAGDEGTDIHKAISTAKLMLDASGADRKVMLLISDCYDNGDVDAQAIALAFRQSGGVLIVVCLRSGASAFMVGEKLASGGFFISAYDNDTAEDAQAYVSGVKGYLCAGNCPYDEGYVPTGRLNFTGFNNWDTFSGTVDLIGKGLYDLVPGNGLYLDLVGSSAPFQGGIRSKETFTFIAAHNYRLSYKLAGNQRSDYSGYTVRVTAGSLLSAARAMDDWRQDFTAYSNDFTGDGSTGTIAFLQETVPSSGAAQSYGNLLDEIVLEDLTAGEIVFSDDFDNENLVYRGPSCGVGTVYNGDGGGSYAYGYDCYGYGCLSEPIKPQAHDPNPPEDIEGVVVLPSYSSTQSYTASCAVGTIGSDVTRTVTYTSFVSALDAAEKALKLATEQATAALDCRTVIADGDILNVDFFFNADGDLKSKKFGRAATGKTADDFWNSFAATDLQLKKTNNDPSLSFLRLIPSVGYGETDPGAGYNGHAFEFDPAHPDAMYTRGLAFYDVADSTPKQIAYAVDGLAEGTYDVFIYAHGPAEIQTGKVNVRTGSLVGTVGNHTWDTSFEIDYGTGETANDATFMNTSWQQGVNFLKFSVTVGSQSDAILIQVLRAVFSGGVFMNGFQIKRTS